MRPRASLILLGGAAIGLGTGIALIFGFGNPDTSETSSPTIGAAAPDFILRSVSGNEVKLSDFKGRPVIINFWATWCYPCRIEMPLFQARYEQHSPNLVILAVNFDEASQDVRLFVDEFNLTFDPLLDPGGRIQELYQIRGYPTTYFVDKDGIIRVLQVGFLTEDQLDKNLEQVGVSE